MKKRKIKIVSHKRKWSTVELLPTEKYKNPYSIDTLKEKVEAHEENEIVEVYCRLQEVFDKNGRWVKNILIIQTEEEYTNEKIAELKERIEAEPRLKDIEKLQALGCHDCDHLIPEIKGKNAARKRENEIAKWIGYLRKNANSKKPYIYQRAIVELHRLDCHEYDSEIDATKRRLEEAKAKRESQYKKLVLPAPLGFKARPKKDERLMHKHVPYQVVSSYYHDEDGLSFGASMDEWYEVTAIDISDTTEGKRMIQSEEKRNKIVDCEHRIQQAQISIKTKICETRIDGSHIISEYKENCTVVWDTMDIYGCGDLLCYDKDNCYLIINNGSDGAFWGDNNIQTGGAGAYGFYIPINSEIQNALHLYENLLKELEKTRNL